MSEIKTIGHCLGKGADGSIWFFCLGCECLAANWC